MGTITESFSTLSQVLLADLRAHPSSERDILLTRFLKPLLPSYFKTGTGQLVDLKDRLLGPFDIVGCWEAYPPLGEGRASQFIADGVAFCLQVRNWQEEDLTQFGQIAGRTKALARKTKSPIFCAAVGFETLPADQVGEFMKSASGQAIDAVLSIGQHVILRNSQGWYGDARQIPWVTEKGEGESLKGFAFWLTHVVQTFMGTPFSLSDYQHL